MSETENKFVNRMSNLSISAELRNKLQACQIALIYGGNSSEREVSAMSATCINEALTGLGYKIKMLDLQHYDLLQLKQDGFDLVFNIVHGGDGENGVVQSVLQYLGIPCTGCSAEQAAITFNKAFTKDIWNNVMLPVANYITLFATQVNNDNLDEIYQHLQKDGIVFVKPARDGSSLGVTKVRNRQQLQQAVELALQHDDMILLEEPIIDGNEFSVAVIDGKALEPAQIIYQGDFYDYQAKYFADSTRVEIPANISSSLRSELQQLAEDATQALGIKGWCRVDILSDSADNLYLVELNSVPGMTSHSIFPRSLLGKSYAQVCEIVLAQAYLNYQQSNQTFIK